MRSILSRTSIGSAICVGEVHADGLIYHCGERGIGRGTDTETPDRFFKRTGANFTRDQITLSFSGSETTVRDGEASGGGIELSNDEQARDDRPPSARSRKCMFPEKGPGTREVPRTLIRGLDQAGEAEPQAFNEPQIGTGSGKLAGTIAGPPQGLPASRKMEMISPLGKWRAWGVTGTAK